MPLHPIIPNFPFLKWGLDFIGPINPPYYVEIPLCIGFYIIYPSHILKMYVIKLLPSPSIYIIVFFPVNPPPQFVVNILHEDYRWFNEFFFKPNSKLCCLFQYKQLTILPCTYWVIIFKRKRLKAKANLSNIMENIIKENFCFEF
jgi:hypothetical protein